MAKTDPVNWTFKQASMYFLEDCETRNREPVRVSEALGTKIGEVNGASSWHPDQPLVRVRTQQGKNGDDSSLKSDAAWRDVELPLEVHEYLKQHANLDNSRLFAQSESQYRKVITKRGIPGFHSLRRFYRTSLFDVPAGIMRHWMGHEDGSDISNRYDKLASDPRVRREFRDKTNKGFRLPV